MTHRRRPHPAVAGRARARHHDLRRLHRDRPRRHQRQPALGQQHADHQRRDARRRRHRDLVRPPGRTGVATGSVSGSATTPGAGAATSCAAADAAARAAVARRGRQRAGRDRCRRRRLGRRRRCRPTSTSSTRSRRRSARRSAGPAAAAGCSTGSSTTTSPRRTSAPPPGCGCATCSPPATTAAPARPPTWRSSAWVGGATRDFADVDALAMEAELAQRLGWGARRVDLPAGRYDTILPPSAVADLMIDAYWYAGARDAHDGQSVYSRRGGGTRIGERIVRAGRQPLLRPGVPRAGVRAVHAVATSSGNESVGLRQRAAARAHRLDPATAADRAAPDPAHGRRSPGSRSRPAIDNLVLERRRRAPAGSTTSSPAPSAGCC